MQRAGVPVTAHTSLQIDTVYTCLRILSNAVNKLGDPRAYTEALNPDNVPYRVWEKEQPPILTNTFGPFQMQYDGRQQTVFSLGLFGEAFWHTLEQDGLGYPTAIEVLHPAFMKVEASENGPKYIYGTGTNRKELDSDRVTHIPFKSMPGAVRGLSAIEFGGVTFAIALAAQEYGQRWFAQGASPSFLLSTEQKLGREVVDSIAQKFLVEHAGLQSAHLPLVVDSGLKVEKISSTPDEAQYIQTLNYSRACIASWFGIPSHLVGGEADKGNVWGKTVQEQSMQFLQWTLSGYLVPLEEAFSRLLPSGVFAAFNQGKLAAPDGTVLAQEINAVRQTQVMTINDVRAHKLGLPPSKDPAADQIIAPLASNTAPDETVPQHFGTPEASQPSGGSKSSQKGSGGGKLPPNDSQKVTESTSEALAKLEQAVLERKREDERRQDRESLLEMARMVATMAGEHDDTIRHILGVIREATDEQLGYYRDIIHALARQQQEANDTLATGQARQAKQMTLFSESVLEVASALRDSRPIVNVAPAEVTNVVNIVEDEPEAKSEKPKKIVRRKTPQLALAGSKPRKIEKVVKRRSRGVTPDPEAASIERRYREELFAMARAITRQRGDSQRLIDTIREVSSNQLEECRRLLEQNATDPQALAEALRGLVEIKTEVNVDAPVVNVPQQEAPVVMVDARQEAPVVNVDARQEAPVVNVDARQEAPVVNVEPEIRVQPSDVYVMPPEDKPKKTKVIRDARGRITGTEQE